MPERPQGGLHQGAIAQVKLLASALARSKGLEEGEVTGQLFGRLSLTLMRANALMLSTPTSLFPILTASNEVRLTMICSDKSASFPW